MTTFTDYTPHHGLPRLAPAQAAKHTHVNAALETLDARLHMRAVSRSLSEPPEDAAVTDRYILAEEPQGAWASLSAGHIASRAEDGGGWRTDAPQPGWTVWVEDEAQTLTWTGAQWQGATGAMDRVDTLGVNTDADATNRLAVRSDAVLLSHHDGGADMRLVLNRAGDADTAALLYQSGFSARAQAGISGDGAYRISVSPDGGQWFDALSVDPASGAVSLPNTAAPAAAPPQLNLLGDGGRFAGSPEPQTVLVGAFSAPHYLSPTNGGVFSAGPQYHHNTQSYGGSAPALDPEIDTLVSAVRPGPADRRYGLEFHTLKITAGSGTSGRVTVDGVAHNLVLANMSAPLPAAFTWSSYVRVLSGSLALVRPAYCTLGLDGQSVGETVRVQPGDGWVHATHSYDIPADTHTGYVVTGLRYYAMPGTELLLGGTTLTAGARPLGPARPAIVTPSQTAWR